MITPLRILIVEDSPADVELTVYRLTNDGFILDWQNVQTETDYLIALDTNPDLILSDWSLPKFSGLRALQIIQGRGLDMPFIIFSGSIGEEAAITALHNGASDYILKDRPERLVQAIQNAVEQKRLRYEHKQVEDALKREQHLMRILLDTVPDTIYFKDDQSRFIRINQSQARKLGANHPEEAIGKTDFDFFGADHAQAAYKDEQEIIRTGQPVINIEELETYPDRPSEWVSTTKMPLRDQKGEIIGTFGISRDITEWKLVENQLQESQRFAQETIDALTAHICVLDEDGTIMAINRAWRDFSDANPPIPPNYGLDSNYLAICDSAQGANSAEGAPFAKGLRAIMRGDQEQFMLEYPCDSPDGKKSWFVARITRFGGKGPLRIVVAHENVSELKLAEAALEQEHYLMHILIDTIPDTVYFKDVEGHFIRINQAQAQRLGVTHPDQVLGKTDFDFFTPVHAHAAAKNEQQIIQSGQPLVNFEELLTYPDHAPEWVSVTKMPLRNPNGEIVGTFGISRDITEQKLNENSLRESEERYRKLVEQSHDLIFTHDFELNILSMNPAMEKLIGISPDSMKGLNFYKITPINNHKQYAAYIQTIAREGVMSGQWLFQAHNDEHILDYQSTLIEQTNQVPVVRCMAQDVTERVHHEQELEAIAAMSSALRSYAPDADILPTILQELNKLVNIDGSAISLWDAEYSKAWVKLSNGEWKTWIGAFISTQDGVFKKVYETNRSLIDEKASYRKITDWPGPLGEIQSAICFPLIASNQLIGALWLGRKGTFNKRDIRVLNTLCDISANAIRNANLYKQVEDRASTLASLYDAGLAINSVLEPHEQLEFLFKLAMDELHAERMVFLSHSPKNFCFKAELCLGFTHELQEDIYQSQYSVDEVQNPIVWVYTNDMPLNSPDTTHDLALSLGDPDVSSVLWVPVKHGNNILGILGAMSTTDHAFSPNQERLLVLFANQAAVALENASLLSETRLQVQRLKSLRSIDETINTNLDLSVTTSVLLEQITDQLNVDAAALLLFDPLTQSLKFINGRGFNVPTLQYTGLRSAQGFTTNAMKDSQIIHISEKDTRNEFFMASPIVEEEHFVEYYGVPLISKGTLKGFLEIFNRSLLTTNETWLDFMGTLAGQAAIAIDNITMFENLQRSNNELMLAYDDTIKGWSQAMDLRDKETEGHTRRVTEMTLLLAKALGLHEDALVHIRRGALLHDMGKLGVPDHILLKPGPLDADEWIVMKKHPEYAVQMLSSIDYLRPAMDIPYCHHEKWDGSGYPRGLKGKEIPLAARIFAIIDVWDALTSNRPYRPAWSKKKVLEYIKGLSGIQFDPIIVIAFIKLMSHRS